jgi:hypothetical protein
MPDLAISGMMITGALLVAIFAVFMAVPLGKEKNDLLVALFLLTFILAIGCGVEWVTALYGVRCNILCEFGTVSRVAVAFCTIGDATVICTLGVVSLPSISTWGAHRIQFMRW